MNDALRANPEPAPSRWCAPVGLALARLGLALARLGLALARLGLALARLM